MAKVAVKKVHVARKASAKQIRAALHIDSSTAKAAHRVVLKVVKKK